MRYNEEEFIKLLKSLDYNKLNNGEVYTYKGRLFSPNSFSIDIREYVDSDYFWTLGIFRDYNPVLNCLSLYIL